MLKIALKLMVKERIKMPKRSKYLRLENYERKINSSFNIYANFESILVLGDNEKQSSQKYTRNKYQNHVVWSYSYKLVYVDDKISQSFKS